MHKRKRQRGFTIIEALIALAILAMLLTSVAAAFKAASMNNSANDDLTAATQMARVVLSRISREVRTASDIDSTSSTLTIYPPDNGSGLTRIKYEPLNGTLIMTRTVNGTSTTSQLIGGDDLSTLTTFAVLREDSSEGHPLSVTVRLGLQVDDHSLAMTASAALRKRQLY